MKAFAIYYASLAIVALVIFATYISDGQVVTRSPGTQGPGPSAPSHLVSRPSLQITPG
jgi:hypothetical protein